MVTDDASKPNEVPGDPPLTSLRQRLLAFFDILGFTERLRVMPPEALHAIYAGLIDDTRDTVFEPLKAQHDGNRREPNFDRAFFLFDSIVLVSRDLSVGDPVRSTHEFVFACELLMEKSFARAMPLRGCIGFGDYLEDAARNIFISREFAHLAHCEKAQEWSGCVVLPEAEERLTSAIFFQSGEAARAVRERTAPLQYYPVPMKGGSTPHCWCLNWAAQLSPRERSAGLGFLTGSKLAHTRAFLEHVESFPDHGFDLPAAFLPAVHAVVSASRCGFRVRYLDSDREPVDPPAGTRMEFRVVEVAEPRGTRIEIDIHPPAKDPAPPGS